MEIKYAPGFQDSMDRLFHWKYAPLRALKFFLRIPRELKWLYQRMTRGWAESDTWGFDSYLAKLIPAGLKYLKENKHGIPAEFIVECADFDEKGTCENCMKKSEEAWNSVLDKMIDGFTAVKEADDLDIRDGKENFDIMSERLEQKRVEGMNLFVKHFYSLWD